LAIAPIVLLLLVFLGITLGRRYAFQKLNVESAIRAQLIPALEKQWGKPIEVGAIESSTFSRIVLRDVVIGRDKTSPLGAFFQTKSITISLNVMNLVLHRDNPLQAITRIALDAPQLDLRRDAHGQLNISRMMKTRAHGGANWNGLVELTSGRIHYEDHFWRSARGRLLRVEARDITGSARFNGNDPVTYHASTNPNFLGDERTRLARTTAAGSIAADGAWTTCDIQLPRAPAALLTEYAFRHGETVAQRGTVRGRLRVMWERDVPRADQLSLGGHLTLQNVAGFARALKVPGTPQPLALQEVNGKVDFDDKTFRAQNVSLTALNTPLRASGVFALAPQPLFDLTLASQSFDAQKLVKFFRQNSARNETKFAAGLQRLTLQAGQAHGVVQVAGNPQKWTASGDVNLPALSFSHPQWGAWRTRTLSSHFKAQSDDGQFTIKALLKALDARGSQPQTGVWKTQGTLQADLQWTNATATNPLQVRFAVPTASGEQQRWGAWRGSQIEGTLRTSSTRNAPLTVQLSVLKLAGRHPQWGVGGARGLDATIHCDNVNAPSAGYALVATANSALGNSTEWGRFQSNGLRIRGNGNARNGAFSFTSGNTRVRNARAGAAQVKALAAKWHWNNAQNTVRWKARSAHIQNNEAGNWRAATLVGVARIGSTHAAQPIMLDVEARDFSGRQQRYGALQGGAARIVAKTSSASTGTWSGLAAFGAVDAAHAKLAAFSPALAQQVKALGVISGKLHFSDLLGKSPVVKGRAQLSRVVVQQGSERVALREITTDIAFGKQRVRLSDLKAQSDYGPLQAALQSELNGSGLRFSILAPQVVLSPKQTNSYLKSAGLHLDGTPRFRLRIFAASSDFSAKQLAVRAQFQALLPQGTLRWSGNASTAPLGARLHDAHLGGTGMLRMRGGSDWKFSGQITLDAAHAVRDNTPDRSSNVLRATGFHLAAQGSLAHTPQGLVPQLTGSATSQNLTIPLHSDALPISLQNSVAAFVVTPQELLIPRFTASGGGDARLVGHAKLQFAKDNAPITLSGQTLLEKFDATHARAWLLALQRDGSPNLQIPTVRGTLFARADFSGALRNGALDDFDLELQSRLYNGDVHWQSDNGEINELPVDAARLETTFHFPQVANAPIQVKNFALWSAGARLAASGVLTPQDDSSLALDINVNVNTLRLRQLLTLPLLRTSLQNVSQTNAFDGLLSGDFKIEGVLTAPRIAGRATVRLAQAYGFELEQASGNVMVKPQQSSDGANTLYIGLTDIEGRIATADSEGTSDDKITSPSPPNLHGEFIANGADNAWHLTLNTNRLTTSRLLLAAERTGDTRTLGWRDLPLSGGLSAGLNLSGTLRASDGGMQFLPRSGEINIRSGGDGQQLRWKGRDLGELTALLKLQDGALQVKQFELAGVSHSTTGDGATQHPLLQVSGVLPLALDAPDLDARLQIENQQLSFVIGVLHEIREALAQHGQNVTYLDAILQRIKGLPPSLEGRVGLEAHLEQSWHAPVVAVNALRIRDPFFLTDSGGRKTLPDLTASFVYDGNDNGAVAIRNAELRLPKTKRRNTSTPSENGDDSNEDLLVRTLQPGRVVPGGEMSLEVEVLNADLGQLADWMPTLRSAEGQPLVRGQLTNFVVQLGGTTGDPQITGSLLGEDWRYRQYSLDRVRLDKFTITNGALHVEPGFLTVVKGDFQSNAAWGTLPWSWGDADNPPGLMQDRPIEVHFPIGKENFGALAGIFVPAIQNVGADAFSGEVTLGGSLAAPRLTGEATISNGSFRLLSSVAELDAGIAGLSGTLRFVDGNRLEIGEDGLHGRLVPASTVQAPQTGNEPSTKRQARDERDKRRQGHASDAPKIAGNFLLQGHVALNLDPQNLLAARAHLSVHRYDLKLALADASYSSSQISGVREVSGALLWKTGVGDPRRSQQVRWVLEGSDGAEKTVGHLTSFAALRLAPNFGESLNALMRSHAEPFFHIEDFGALDSAWSTLPQGTIGSAKLQAILRRADGGTGRVELKDFRFDWKKVARGTLNGHLSLDNGTSSAPAIPLPFEPPRFHAGAQSATENRTDGARIQTIQNDQGDDNDVNRERQRIASQEPLRFSGDLALRDTELYGAPESNVNSEAAITDIADRNAGTVAELWPDAPIFNVRFKLGNDVKFVSSNLAATITGELTATGTPREPSLLGTVYTRNGQITFPNARARLVSGELNIAARRDLVTGAMRLRVEIDATARGRSGRYEFTLRLRGPLDTGEQSTQDLRVDVTSNPPLSSDEAFAQLLGTAALNRGNLDGQDNETYARAIVGLLSGPLFSGIERSLSEALGLDTIALDYRIDEPIGIEIGKAIGDRLYISYRRTLQRTSGQKMPFDLRIEYRLKGNLELGLETDERGEHKLTIEKRWRF
jgi:hypothetical protein